MKTDNYRITQYTIQSILNYVENSQIAIPEIQRPFVWKGKEVRDLIDSLYEGYPIGYLIIWQNSQVKLKNFGRGGTKKILIDGQQRVTALMAALLGRSVLDEGYQSVKIRIGFNPYAKEGEDQFAVTDESIENDPLWISDISLLFRKDFSYRQFEKEYKAKNPDVDITALDGKIDRLRSIMKNQIGIIELSFMLDIDTVSEIFIRINLQGKPLNQEDFVMSKIAVNEQYQGDDIRNCIDYFCHLMKEPSFYDTLRQNEAEFIQSEYGQSLAWTKEGVSDLYVPSYTDVLKVVMIRSFGRSKVGELVGLLSGRAKGSRVISEKRIEEAFASLGEGVLAFVKKENFEGYTNALKKAGFTGSRLIYSQSLLNYGYAMYLMMVSEGIDPEERDRLMARWMMMSLLTGHYQSSPDSVVNRDCQAVAEQGVKAYLQSIEESELTDQFFETVLPERYASASNRTAPYLAYLAMQNVRKAPSLYDASASTAELYLTRAEAYQILPKSYLAKLGCKDRAVYGQIANLTYITKDTKTLVRRKAPADYEEDLKEKIGTEQIAATLQANAVPEDIFTVTEENVMAVLEQRRRQMANLVQEYYRGL